jgi:GH15 family glucan-1,4-alpha-glucosidase
MNDFNDFGLDLAVIGNGQTAALLEPASRLVWWCYPRFDGDPVFSRLLAGDEEKGFCDIVLNDMVDYTSDYERNTPVVSTILTNSENASVKITDFAPIVQLAATTSVIAPTGSPSGSPRMDRCLISSARTPSS